MQDGIDAEEIAEQLIAAARSGKWEQLIGLLDESYIDLMGLDYAADIVRLYDALPSDVAQSSFWINVAGSVACEMTRDYSRQYAFLKNTEAFDAAETQGALAVESHRGAARAGLSGTRMMKSYHNGDFEASILEGMKTLAFLEEDEIHGQSSILCMLGIACFAQGDAEAARNYWRKGGNAAMLAGWTYTICLDQFGVAMAHYTCNRLSDAEAACKRVITISDLGSQPISSSCYAHLLLARIHYERNELEAALHQLDLAHEIALSANERLFFLDEETARAHVECALGKTDSAIDRANRCMAKFARLTRHEGLEGARSMMASIWSHAGFAHAAADCLDAYWDFEPTASVDDNTARKLIETGLYGHDFRNVWRPSPLLEFARLRIQEHRTAGLDAWLARAQASANARGHVRLALKAAVLRALCAYSEDDIDSALEKLSNALILAETERCVRMFADEGKPMEELLDLAFRKRMHSRFMAELRDAMRTERAGADPSARGPLRFTRREVDVIRLLVEGYGNADIAKRLYLSLSTIKNHIHSIYTKLGVRNRAEAIARIHDLGLLE